MTFGISSNSMSCGGSNGSSGGMSGFDNISGKGNSGDMSNMGDMGSLGGMSGMGGVGGMGGMSAPSTGSKISAPAIGGAMGAPANAGKITAPASRGAMNDCGPGTGGTPVSRFGGFTPVPGDGGAGGTPTSTFGGFTPASPEGGAGETPTSTFGGFTPASPEGGAGGTPTSTFGGFTPASPEGGAGGTPTSTFGGFTPASPEGGAGDATDVTGTVGISAVSPNPPQAGGVGAGLSTSQTENSIGFADNQGNGVNFEFGDDGNLTSFSTSARTVREQPGEDGAPSLFQIDGATTDFDPATGPTSARSSTSQSDTAPAEQPEPPSSSIGFPGDRTALLDSTGTNIVGFSTNRDANGNRSEVRFLTDGNNDLTGVEIRRFSTTGQLGPIPDGGDALIESTQYDLNGRIIARAAA